MSTSNRRGRRWLLGLFAALGAVTLIAAACGDDDDGSGATASPAVEATLETGAADGFAGEGVIEGSGQYDWQVVRVDGGTKPDIALAPDGAPLIAYMLERRGDDGFVRVATGGDGGFSIETLQNGYLYGPLDIEVSAEGTVAVAYHNHDWEDAAVAVLRDGEWEVDRVGNVNHDGWDDSLAFGPDGSIHLLAIDPSQFGTGDSVQYATLRDGRWLVELVGSGPEPYEWGTDIAVDAGGTVHAVYFDLGGRDLMYATNDGSGWTIERIYESGDAGRFASLALDGEGLPHVAFFQSDEDLRETGPAPGNIVYGAFDGDGWSFEQVDRLEHQVFNFEGARRTVALELGADGPVLAFIDESRVAVATLVGGEWEVETLLEAGADPFQIVGLALDDAGAPHLTFATVTGNGPLDGEVWYVAPVRKQ